MNLGTRMAQQMLKDHVAAISPPTLSWDQLHWKHTLGVVCWDGKSVQNHMDLESTEECLCVAAGTRMVSSSHRYRRTKAVQPPTVLMLMTYFSCISKSLLKVGGVWILWAVPMLLFFLFNCFCFTSATFYFSFFYLVVKRISWPFLLFQPVCVLFFREWTVFCLCMCESGCLNSNSACSLT